MIAIFFCFTITTHEMFSHESMNFPSKCNRWHGNRFSILPFILFVPKNRQANQIVFIRQKSLFKIKFELHIRCEYSICCFFFSVAFIWLKHTNATFYYSAQGICLAHTNDSSTAFKKKTRGKDQRATRALNIVAN